MSQWNADMQNILAALAKANKIFLTLVENFQKFSEGTVFRRTNLKNASLIAGLLYSRDVLYYVMSSIQSIRDFPECILM